MKVENGKVLCGCESHKEERKKYKWDMGKGGKCKERRGG
jgi:hypothetical protein